MTESTNVSNFEKKIRTIQKKKKTNLIVKIISACLTFCLIVVYFLLPVSKVSNSKINGNIFYTSDEILSIAGINSKIKSAFAYFNNVAVSSSFLLR